MSDTDSNIMEFEQLSRQTSSCIHDNEQENVKQYKLIEEEHMKEGSVCFIFAVVCILQEHMGDGYECFLNHD